MIVKKITHQFEVAEEEARFARNDVHNEALLDFKKMHSQRYAVVRSPGPRDHRRRGLILCFIIQGSPIQRAGGPGDDICYSREGISGGVRSRSGSER